MLFSFLRYFLHYIFFTKTRQRLLFLAMVGLILSSFSLLVLQSIMGGLQKGLVTRSQNVEGRALLILKEKDEEFALTLLKELRSEKWEAYPEYEIELLLKYENYISPVVVHGLDFEIGVPRFLQKKQKGTTIIGRDLANKIRAEYLSQVILISPSHLHSLLGDVPRQVSATLGDLVSTGIPEVDIFHLWTRLSLVQNLIREHHINRIRIFSEGDFEQLRKNLKEQYGEKVQLSTWEEQNASLVWALNLETTVMVFLFIIMTLLVAISITSGFMIFFDKIKIDLSSFWILGASRRKIKTCCVLFIHFLSFFTTIFGLLLGHIFLYFLDLYGAEIMPDVFIDRKIPVFITFQGVCISFLVPYLISVVFSHFSLRNFQKDSGQYLALIRAVG